MRRDPFLQMDYLVYDAAVQRLRCQLAACGLPPLHEAPDEAHGEAQQQQHQSGGGGGTSTRGAGAASRRARRRARKLRGRLSVMQSK